MQCELLKKCPIFDEAIFHNDTAIEELTFILLKHSKASGEVTKVTLIHKMNNLDVLPVSAAYSSQNTNIINRIT